MHRRGLATLALVLLVSLAGCSLFSGGSGPTPTAAPSATPAPGGSPTATPGATATPSATPTEGTGAPAGEYPAGYGADGVTDPRAALEGHVTGLATRDSYIVKYNGTVIRGNRLATIGIFQAAEVPDGEAYVVTDVSGQGTLTYYFADGTRYRRFDPPGANNTEYSSAPRSYSMAAFAGGDLLRPLLENVSYSSVERIEREDGTFYRYSGTDYEHPRSLFGPVDPENVTGFRAALVVDEDGVVRRLAYQARLDRGNETVYLDVHAEVVGLDSTSVDRPDWFERAA